MKVGDIVRVVRPSKLFPAVRQPADPNTEFVLACIFHDKSVHLDSKDGSRKGMCFVIDMLELAGGPW